jgi:hypothetical protein
MPTISKNIKNSFWFFIITSLLLRIIFCFWGSQYYFGKVTFTFGDSFSYTESFLNLLKYGHYSFDLTEPDASLYRGPIYPLFWGLHYLLFGDLYVYQAVAVSQSVLDTISGALIFLIIQRTTQRVKFALAGMAIYSFHPIFIVHVPITGTETFATFLTLLTFYCALVAKETPNSKLWLLVGVLCGAATLTRQYLGILLPTALIYLLFIHSFELNKDLFKKSSTILFGFAILTTPWLLRNIALHETPSILMGKTTGYKAYKEDYVAFNRFYTLYFVDITPILLNISQTGNDDLNDDLRLSDYRLDLDRVNSLAHECGTSFAEVRRWGRNSLQDTKKEDQNCNEEIVSIYQKIRAQALKNGGLALWSDVPIKNVSKAILKSELTNKKEGWKSKFITAIFISRTAIILLALIGIFYIKIVPEFVFLFFTISLIAYIAAITRQVEMRYLVQSDAILVALGIIAISILIKEWKKNIQLGH